MPRSASGTPPRLTRWETIGAWTGVWTPPKNVQVPPVPVRKLVLWGLVGVVVVAGLLALIIPVLQHGKQEGAARLAREHAQAVHQEAARLRADQRVHHATFTSAPVAALQAAITADAKARVGAGTLNGPVRSTTCKPAGVGSRKYPRSQVFNCFVATSDNIRGEGKDLLATGYPFIATVYYGTHRLAWCKENPQPGEKTRGHGLARVAMSPACAGKLAPLL